MLMVAGAPILLAVLIVVFGISSVVAIHVFGRCAYMRLPPFIVTLAGLTAWRGARLLLVTLDLTVSGLPRVFSNFSRAASSACQRGSGWSFSWLSRPMCCCTCRAGAATSTQSWRALKRRGFRRSTSAREPIFLVYMISSTCAALAGILAASRLSLGIAAPRTLANLGDVIVGDRRDQPIRRRRQRHGTDPRRAGPLYHQSGPANLLNANPFWQRIITGLLPSS